MYQSMSQWACAKDQATHAANLYFDLNTAKPRFFNSAGVSIAWGEHDTVNPIIPDAHTFWRWQLTTWMKVDCMEWTGFPKFPWDVKIFECDATDECPVIFRVSRESVDEIKTQNKQKQVFQMI